MSFNRAVMQTNIRLDEALRAERLAKAEGLSVYAWLQKLIRSKIAESEMQGNENAA